MGAFGIWNNEKVNPTLRFSTLIFFEKNLNDSLNELLKFEYKKHISKIISQFIAKNIYLKPHFSSYF